MALKSIKANGKKLDPYLISGLDKCILSDIGNRRLLGIGNKSIEL